MCLLIFLRSRGLSCLCLLVLKDCFGGVPEQTLHDAGDRVETSNYSAKMNEEFTDRRVAHGVVNSQGRDIVVKEDSGHTVRGTDGRHGAVLEGRDSQVLLDSCLYASSG